MIKVGVHIHYRGKIGPFSEKYIKILALNNINYEILDINNFNFWERLKTCSHFIYNWSGNSDQFQIAQSILPVIEKELQIKCFPDYNTCWHHDDKIKEYYLLKNLDYPIIDSYIFWEKEHAINWLKQADFPLVFKLKSSAGSKDVVLVKNYYHGKRIVKKMFGTGVLASHVPGNIGIKIKDFKLKNFTKLTAKKIYRFFKGRDINYNWRYEKNYALFQKFLPNNKYDTRVTVIGNRAFAFRRFNRDNDFRSSGSGKISYEKSNMDVNFVLTALKISNEMKFQSMAYDFLYDQSQPAFCEISYTYLDNAIFGCPGYWDSELKWHDGHYWPQYFHLIDLLERQDLIQPIFNESSI